MVNSGVNSGHSCGQWCQQWSQLWSRLWSLDKTVKIILERGWVSRNLSVLSKSTKSVFISRFMSNLWLNPCLFLPCFRLNYGFVSKSVFILGFRLKSVSKHRSMTAFSEHFWIFIKNTEFHEKHGISGVFELLTFRHWAKQQDLVRFD